MEKKHSIKLSKYTPPRIAAKIDTFSLGQKGKEITIPQNISVIKKQQNYVSDLNPAQQPSPSFLLLH